MATNDIDNTEKDSIVLSHPYDIDDLTVYTIILALVSCLNHHRIHQVFWISITTGIAAAIIFAADIVGKRLIDIRLAIEEKTQSL